MLRAQQQKLAQDVNTELVDIRGQEIDYFVQFFTSFGTQCALITGFQYVALAEMRTDDSQNSIIFTYIFWAFNALTIGLSLHVLLCSAYISVYGQGLALRGPIGSMVRAVEGMVIEQQQVVYTFTFCIISLAITTSGAFFVQMDWQSAVACSIILAGCVYGWYHYCLRIYNRFKWVDSNKVAWSNRSVDGDSSRSDPIQKETAGPGAGAVNPMLRPSMSAKDAALRESLVAGAVPPLATPGAEGEHMGRASEAYRPRASEMARMEHRPSFTETVKSVFTRGVARRNSDSSDSSDDSSSRPTGGSGKKGRRKYSNQSPDALVKASGSLRHEGYISMRKTSTTMFGMESWTRVYMVFCVVPSGESLIVYYHSKTECETSPGKPIKARPIDVSEYLFSTTKGQVIDGSMFGIVLTPTEERLKPLIFRCDTHDEFMGWSSIIGKALKPR